LVSEPERPGLRYELKLAGQEASYPRLAMALRIQPAAIRTLYPARRVQSIYLDTPFDRALAENLAGISHREKLRFRWYGDGCEEVRGTLERKVRENTLGWKETFSIEEPMRVQGAHRTAFVAALAHAVPDEWRYRLDGLEPVQWISYLREYLTTADRRVRLTIDRELLSWDQRGLVRLSNARSAAAPRSRVFVLELKCAPAHLDVAEDIVRRLPWPVDRCSKFVLASDPTHGPVPSLEPL